MKLPKWATKVTPFSKGLAMTLFILFPFVGFWVGMNYQKNISPKIELTENISEIKFVGTITDLDNSCQVDGQCKIKVDDRWVIINPGHVSNRQNLPIGKLINIETSIAKNNSYIDNKSLIGKKVEVYAQKSNNSYTLIGKEAYYIKLIH